MKHWIPLRNLPLQNIIDKHKKEPEKNHGKDAEEEGDAIHPHKKISSQC